MKEPYPVVGYVRLSQEDRQKKDTSIENQTKMIQDFCEKKGFDLIKIYNEGYVSGSDWKRKEFNEMLNLVPEKVFKAIIVKDDTRFARDQELFMTKLNDLIAYKIKLFSVYDDDYTLNKLIAGVKAAVGEDPVSKGNRSQREMMVRKAKDGQFFGLPPTGFKIKKEIVIVNGKEKFVNNWVIDDEKAKVVKKIYKMFVNEQLKVEEISALLKVPKDTVYKILTNKKYIGIFEYKQREKLRGEVVNITENSYKLNYPNIINKELFDKAQTLKAERSKIPPGYRRFKKELLDKYGN